jgi:hypothetical protein
MADCPIKCGQCCTYWADLPMLRKRWPYEQAGMTCPGCGSRGCTLDPMPRACKAYLCDHAVRELRELRTEKSRRMKSERTSHA